jgi:hypothetical protein
MKHERYYLAKWLGGFYLPESGEKLEMPYKMTPMGFSVQSLTMTNNQWALYCSHLDEAPVFRQRACAPYNDHERWITQSVVVLEPQDEG